ncbi:MAG TPA: nucleotide exchange factor GrpE [Thermoplasmata archaeon]|nr:nucleotide exchange factor GrpE [Thermoplasmata archaeon]
MAEETPTVQREGPPPAESSAPPASQDEAAELRREKEELLTRLKYLQAEFENYRKRAERDTETILKFAHETLLARLLPVVDELDAAVARLEGTAGDGVRMVRDNLLKALREAGLQEIPARGLPFDPYLMDCVQRVRDKDSKEGVVKEVVRKGYRYHDRVVRPAQVVVNGEGEADG